MKNKLVFICIISCIILLFVCLPFPRRIDIDMQGATVMQDGRVGEEFQLTITGWKLDYLFLGDKLKVDIKFSDNSQLSLAYVSTNSGELYSHDSPDFLVTSWMGYDSAHNEMDGGYFALSSDYSCCVLTWSGEDFRTVGYTSSIANPQAVLETYDALFSQKTPMEIDTTIA